MDYIFERGNFTEAELENAIIELFTQQGYTYVSGEDIHRTFDTILIEDDLRSYLTLHYKKDNLSETEMQKIINKLSLINSTPLYQGNREAFRLVNEGFDLIRDDISKVALHVDYINYDEPDKNIFKVIVGNFETKRHNPFPDPILKALEMLDISEEGVCYVGDGLDDMRSATAAKVTPILLDRIKEYDNESYNKIYSLMELL